MNNTVARRCPPDGKPVSAPPSRERDGADALPARRQRHPGGVLTWVAAVSSFAAAGVGLVSAPAYDAAPATVEMLRGFDLVTLLVAVPLLVLSQLKVAGWPLVRSGVLAYLAYGYLFAAVTGGLGTAFLLDVTVLSSSTFALIRTLRGMAAAPLASLRGLGARFAAVALGVLALSLGGMWVTAALRAAASGEIPVGSLLVESDLAVRLGITLDLWLLVPLYMVAATQLWRRRPWGRVLGVLAVVSGLLHQLSYQAGMVFQAWADVPGAHAFDPVEPVVVACYLVALLALVMSGSAASGMRVGGHDGRD